MRESVGATKPKGRVKAKATPSLRGGGLRWDPRLHGLGRTTGPSGHFQG